MPLARRCSHKKHKYNVNSQQKNCIVLQYRDRFALLENGYAQIVGRIKETIIRGGENIEPKEVEGLIIKHPDIIDVQVSIATKLIE